jgi:putative ABC transport system permease protein
MYFLRFARTYPVGAAVICFALGGAAALAGAGAAGWFRNAERSVEQAPAPTGARRVDLVVIQKGKPLGLDSEFSEYFVQETAKMPEVDRVSEGVVGNASVLRSDGSVDDNITLIQGWKPDNFGYEDLDVLEGRKLHEGDRHKVILGRILAENLKKKVGDTITFVGDPDHPYEIVGVFKSRVVFEEGGGIVPLEDAQALHTRPGKVTGFSVRVNKTSPDSRAEIETVRQKIEALRDPQNPAVRLSAEPADRY